MAIEVVGFREERKAQITCFNCLAILRYAPSDEHWTNRTDEGCRIKVIYCPNCAREVRTNH